MIPIHYMCVESLVLLSYEMFGSLMEKLNVLFVKQSSIAERVGGYDDHIDRWCLCLCYPLYRTVQESDI